MYGLLSTSSLSAAPASSTLASSSRTPTSASSARSAPITPSTPSSSSDSPSPPPISSISSDPSLIPTSSQDQLSVSSGSCWSLFDDLYFDTVYDHSEAQNHTFSAPTMDPGGARVRLGRGSCKKRKKQSVGPVDAHLASGSWNLSREQGNKLLASRFRGDCLYICNWPGCIHAEEKRKYMLFRGVFKNFKRSRVWRTISDSNRGTIGLDCAFCACRQTWDLNSSFCLRSFFGFHDDGEPVVRAYVCENGHVSGAWTERPMYT